MAHTKNGKLIGAAAAAQNKDWQEMIALNQSESLTVGTRQWMIEQIKHLSPADYDGWYNEVYKLRSAGKTEEYEASINARYAELAELQTLKHSDHDFTACLEEVENFTPPSYKDKHVPGMTCPKCGGLLIVKERRRFVRTTGGYDITPFVACSMWDRTGCRYKEDFTAEIKAAIDHAVSVVDLDLGI